MNLDPALIYPSADLAVSFTELQLNFHVVPLFQMIIVMIVIVTNNSIDHFLASIVLSSLCALFHLIFPNTSR